MLAREDIRGAPISRTRVPSTGTDFVFIIPTGGDAPNRISLPSEAASIAVERAVVMVGFDDGWVRTYVHGDTEPVAEAVVEAGSAIRAVSRHRDGWLTATASGRVYLVDPEAQEESAVRLIASGIDAPIDIQSLIGLNQAIVTDVSGTMRLIDIDRGIHLGVLRTGPGWGDALPIIDPDRNAVWVPSTLGLELVPTDPAAWARELCRRSTRRLTDEEITTHVPAGLQTGVGSACTNTEEPE